MKGLARHPLRVTGRLLWLVGELVLAALNYARRCALSNSRDLPKARAHWLQESSRRVLSVFGAEISVAGGIPQSGLLVCNHLSYLDILLIAAFTPSRFVAKSEVESWPVFGWFARLAGTIFVERNRRLKAAQSNEEITAALQAGSLVVLFPEGTSSGGETVLPFKSSLLEPAARNLHRVTVGCIVYQLANNEDVSEEVCYWKDMTMLPHLVNLLSKRTVHAFVRFAETQLETTDRKTLALRLHSDVLRLRWQNGRVNTPLRQPFARYVGLQFF